MVANAQLTFRLTSAHGVLEMKPDQNNLKLWGLIPQKLAEVLREQPSASAGYEGSMCQHYNELLPLVQCPSSLAEWKVLLHKRVSSTSSSIITMCLPSVRASVLVGGLAWQPTDQTHAGCCVLCSNRQELQMPDPSSSSSILLFFSFQVPLKAWQICSQLAATGDCWKVTFAVLAAADVLHAAFDTAAAAARSDGSFVNACLER